MLDKQSLTDITTAVEKCRASLDDRLALNVALKLGVDVCSVRLVRWDKRITGDVPVFRVPTATVASARALGLTLEN